MFCEKCGAQLKNNGAFCPNCGNRVQETRQETEVVLNRQGLLNKITNARQRNRMLVGMAVILLGLGVVSFIFFRLGVHYVLHNAPGITEQGVEISIVDDAMADINPPADVTDPGESVLSGTTGAAFDYAAEMKINREQIRSKNKEALLEIINNAAVEDGLKQDAVDKMVAMTDIAEREAAAEMLLEAKGFTDAVISIMDDSCDVIINMGEITDAKRAQVEDIVMRKTNIPADRIVITPIAAE